MNGRLHRLMAEVLQMMRILTPIKSHQLPETFLAVPECRLIAKFTAGCAAFVNGYRRCNETQIEQID